MKREIILYPDGNGHLRVIEGRPQFLSHEQVKRQWKDFPEAITLDLADGTHLVLFTSSEVRVNDVPFRSWYREIIRDIERRKKELNALLGEFEKRVAALERLQARSR